MTTTTISETKKLDSTNDSIALVEQLIDQLCLDFKIQDELIGNIIVAVTEAVNNAITHGNQLDKNKKVELSYTYTGNELHFKLTDQGNGFDPLSIPDPTDPANIDKPYGRGIFIMQNLADDVSFEDEGRTSILKFNLK